MTKKKLAKRTMPRKTKAPRDRPQLIEITRHLTGPPRRAPGQRLWMTAQQIKQQGIQVNRDYRIIETA